MRGRKRCEAVRNRPQRMERERRGGQKQAAEEGAREETRSETGRGSC